MLGGAALTENATYATAQGGAAQYVTVLTTDGRAGLGLRAAAFEVVVNLPPMEDAKTPHRMQTKRYVNVRTATAHGDNGPCPPSATAADGLVPSFLFLSFLSGGRR